MTEDGAVPAGVSLRGLAVAAGVCLVALHVFPVFLDLPPAAANLSPFDVGIFIVETLKARPIGTVLRGLDWGRAGACAGVGLAIWLLSRRQTRAAAWIGAWWSRLMSVPDRRFVAGAAVAQFVLSSGIAFLVFDAMPHVQDEIGQYFQARIFAGGRLNSHPFAYPDFFSFYSVIQTDKWYSQHPPGFPLLLAPMLRFGLAPFLNPLLAAGCTVLIHRLGKLLYGDATGRLAALVLLLSPFHAFMSASFMNHTATLFLLLVVAAIALDERASAALETLAGAAFGWALMTRPLVSLALGAFLIAAGLLRRRGGRARARLLIAVAGGASVPMAFFLWSNLRLNGGPLVLSYSVADAAYVRLGFANALVPYSPAAAWVKTAQLFRGLSLHLFAWPVPSLAIVWLLFLRAEARGREFLLLAAGLTVPFAYFFYWFQDMCLGPRFAYESIPFWILLTAGAVAGATAGSGATYRRFLAGVLLAASLWSVALEWPSLARNYSNSYWGVDRRLTRAVEEMDLDHALVLVNEDRCPWYYGSGFWANDPDLGGPVVYARDLGASASRVLLEGFPGRSLYLYDCVARRLVPVEVR